MLERGTRTVKAMYEEYAYPSPVVGDSLIYDSANVLRFFFPGGNLANKRILDAGCGTGHRLIASAKTFPNASFLGVDMTRASLDTAQALARRHGISNVMFKEADLLDLELKEKYDIVFSGGVIHHLKDPQKRAGQSL
jgi:2-polyprenyl-3-methyl-5-hydroxy-6-metoxy-1,4-benzoquinol methylase